MFAARLAPLAALLALALACSPAAPAVSGQGAAPSGSAAAAAVSPVPTAAGQPAAVGTAADAPLTSVIACIPSRSDTILPIFAAEDGGFLRQQGIDANIPYFAGGQVDAALAAGQCDFVFGAGGVGPLLQGLDVVVVAVTTTYSPGELWGRPPLQTIADLKGHTVGSSGPGSLSWRTARYFLQVNGLTPDQDVAVLTTGDAVSTLGALTAGRVDSALLFSPGTFEAKKQGLNLLYKAPASLQLLNTGLVSTQHYVAANRDVVRGMVRGITDAMVRLKADEAFYSAEISKFTDSTMDPATIHDYWVAAGELFAVPPRGSHEGAVAALNLYAEEATNENLDALAQRWLDMSIVDELYPPGASR
ncbi:MAG TPA: ABC transporter substrate-binding protein [Chloroflexota bacterium]|nr:ABC transporter substrate-binding protein [Chloroflexota bacterium]